MNYNNDEIIPVGYPIVNVSGNGPAMYTDQIVYEDELDKNLTEVIRELKRGGKTYSFKIEDNRLYVSIDGGETWTLVGDVSGISAEERQAIIDEAEAAASEAISGALDDISQAKSDVNTIKNIIGTGGQNIVKNSEYNVDKNEIETRITNTEGNIQSLAQTVTGPTGVVQRVGQIQTDIDGIRTRTTTLEQRADSIDLRVAAEESATTKMSRLLVGTNGIWEGVSSLDASSADLQAARKAMKDNIISQSVVKATILRDKYERFVTKEGYIIYVGQTPGQDDVILYCYDEESIPNKYKIKVNGEYVEWTGSVQTVNELSDTYPNYEQYVEYINNAFSNISQTSDEIVAHVGTADNAAQWVLSSDRFIVNADHIDLEGIVEHLDVHKIDVLDDNDDIVGGFHSSDSDGGSRLWLGSDNFADAPFKVDENGVVSATNYELNVFGGNLNTRYKAFDIRFTSQVAPLSLTASNPNVRLYCSANAGNSGRLYVKLPTPSVNNLGTMFNIWIDPFILSDVNSCGLVTIDGVSDSTFNILMKWDYSFGGTPTLSPSFKQLQSIASRGGYIQFTCVEHGMPGSETYHWLVTDNELYSPEYGI